MRRLALAALLAAGCGGGTDGQPVAPTTPRPAPALAPEPPPPPPPEPPPAPTGIRVAEVGQDFIVWEWDPVEGATGYELEVFPTELSIATEELTVRVEGLEPDTEFVIYVRAVRETAGGRAAGPWSAPSPVKTWGEPRVCTDELRRARGFQDARLPREWNGTPFRVDLYDHFPEIAGIGYPESQLAVVQEFADRIEEQIGYPIIGAGSVIPVPENMPKGWNRPSTNNLPNCGRRKRHQILGVHLSASPRGHSGGGGFRAFPRCAVLEYWVGEDSPSDSAWGRTVVRHELFHLFGFGHSLETHPHEADLGGVPMSPELTVPEDYGLAIFAPTFDDIDALRCIFPEGG